ncbi:hypothetical protein Pan258_57970 [Symmachiella dynata]|nr:hypothetical protein Pan258_57970 [Symmachiella dynata]
MGDWVYYVTTMRLSEVAEKINYAHELHSNQALNELIQRQLNKSRGKKIARYLLKEEQRFFNSMVVGVYGGDPSWYDFAEIVPERPGELVLPSGAKDSFGFLGFTGKEKLFALDGQHRLSGIKQAIKENSSEIGDDQITVIFVGHHKGEEGLQRTRRLFTVLNKTAKPVLKGDIIALDEDDIMAICVRRLLDRCPFFNRGQVAMRLQNSLPPSDKTSWTTITMMYDILTVIFRHIYPQYHEVPWKTLDEMKHERPSEEVIDSHYEFAERYFQLLADAFSEVAEVFSGKTPAKAVEKHRVDTGGSVLFRPLGQRMYAQLVAELSKSYELDNIFEWIGLLPTQLDNPPYADVIWDTGTHTMTSSKTDAAIVRNLLLYMLGEEARPTPDALKIKYAQYLGQNDDDIELPTPVVASE